MTKVVFEQNPVEFNAKLVEELKKIKEFQIPEWSLYVKSGVSRQRVPEDPDFWYKRAASILRQLYIKGVIGVNRLRTRYGSRKNRGVRPDKFKRASGKIIRTILQQAESANLVEKVSNQQHGRRLTPNGRKFLDLISEKTKNGKKA
ncbi:MAG: 30S ribosomal protein S19e [Nanoarchaeota archaeon]